MNPKTVVQLRDIEAKHHERLREIGRTFAQFPISFSSYAGFGETPLDTLPRLSDSLLQALTWYRSDEQWFPRSYFDPPPDISEEIGGMFEGRLFSIFGALKALYLLLPTVKPLYDPDSDWTPGKYPDGGLGLHYRHEQPESERRIMNREELGIYFAIIDELYREIEQIYADFHHVIDSNWSMGWGLPNET